MPRAMNTKIEPICAMCCRATAAVLPGVDASIAIHRKNKKTGLLNGWDGVGMGLGCGWDARQRYFKTAKQILGLH